MQPDLFQERIERPLDGITIIRGFLDEQEQQEAIIEAQEIASEAPFFKPKMADGTEFCQMLTNSGQWGWVAGENAPGILPRFVYPALAAPYRYQDTHPVTGNRWPAIPEHWLHLAGSALGELQLPPCEMQSCLLNWYSRESGKLGMHVDKTEQDRTSPIVTFSLGDSCLFRVRLEINSYYTDVQLHSGDVCIMHDAGRNYAHGVLKIIPSVPLTVKPGRLSLTLRKVKY